jgi:DNA-binding NarL/FixJ family response regulator
VSTGAQVGQRAFRVLIADDHALLRWTLGELISGDPTLELVSSCPDGETAVVEAERERPDLVVMDLKMSGIGGIEATRRIVRARPAARVVILTGYAGLALQAAALAAGACCVLTKDIAPDRLLARLRECARLGSG